MSAVSENTNPIKMDPQDPFPFFEEGVLSYSHEKEHSAQVDSWLGFQIEPIEAKILSNSIYDVQNSAHGFLHEYWRGLPIGSLQTPYTEIKTILTKLKLRENETVVDLGAAYGRMAHVIGRDFPLVNFCGYEVVHERLDEGLRVLSLQSYLVPHRLTLLKGDLSSIDFQLPAATVYFLYDFGSPKAIKKTIEDLKLVARTQPIRLVARGRSARQIIERENPWLTLINPPQHFSRYTIYSS